MIQRLVLKARRAHTTRVTAYSVSAVDILSCRERQGELGHSRLSMQQQCVGYVAAVNHAPNLLYSTLIAYYITESHITSLFNNAKIIILPHINKCALIAVSVFLKQISQNLSNNKRGVGYLLHRLAVHKKSTTLIGGGEMGNITARSSKSCVA